ncbi:MAG: hypothetical protein BWY63_00274 [Chloroflexi bacterium ADurb.Bin360]|nr:MAG: hypothetical protein BWY63_00274 [Chloroflexi bacterium ADurb.Bin360]
MRNIRTHNPLPTTEERFELIPSPVRQRIRPRRNIVLGDLFVPAQRNEFVHILLYITTGHGVVRLRPLRRLLRRVRDQPSSVRPGFHLPARQQRHQQPGETCRNEHSHLVVAATDDVLQCGHRVIACVLAGNRRVPKIAHINFTLLVCAKCNSADGLNGRTFRPLSYALSGSSESFLRQPVQPLRADFAEELRAELANNGHSVQCANSGRDRRHLGRRLSFCRAGSNQLVKLRRSLHAATDGHRAETSTNSCAGRPTNSHASNTAACGRRHCSNQRRPHSSGILRQL